MIARRDGPACASGASSRGSCTRRGATGRSSRGRRRSTRRGPRSGPGAGGCSGRGSGPTATGGCATAAWRATTCSCRPCAPPSTCGGRSPSGWPEGRSLSGAAPEGREGGQDEALRPVGAPIIGSKVPSATPDGVNHLTSPRRAKLSYYVRQVGRVVWWYGENDPDGPTFSNVARGALNAAGNQVRFLWADVPKGFTLSSGKLVVNVVSGTQLAVVAATGGFGGTAFFKEPPGAKRHSLRNGRQ